MRLNSGSRSGHSKEQRQGGPFEVDEPTVLHAKRFERKRTNETAVISNKH